MTAIVLHLIPASLYGALGLHFWRSRWRAATLAPSRGLQPWERALLAAALLVHGWGLFLELFPAGSMRFGFSSALATMLWLALLFYWVESWFARLEGLQTIVLPVAALCALLPVVFPVDHRLANAASPVFRAHFLMAMLAYSLFTLAALHALLMAAAEKRLHSGRLTRALAQLPPLLTMETLLFRLIHMAFALLTLTLATGIMFSESIFGTAMTVSHKTVFAVLSWLIFAALLFGRHAYGWRGRTALRWTLSGFVVLLLAYVGSRFVLDVILARG